MKMTAEQIELTLYRSGLLRKTARPYHVTPRCKTIRKHAARYDRARLAMCNGVPRWNVKLGRMLAELTEEDQARLDAQLEDAQARITAELKAMLRPGTILDFRGDPRAPILRFVNRENTKDGWIE